MQEKIYGWAYSLAMANKEQTSRLKALREAAGLSLRELARQIGEDHSNVRYWETSGHPPRSDVLPAMAQALGVTLEELLGVPKSRRGTAPSSRVGRAFEAVARMPRRQQQKIIDVVEAFVAQHANSV
jgi:transcriptional regulator with XRE-family HTH domain